MNEGFKDLFKKKQQIEVSTEEKKDELQVLFNILVKKQSPRAGYYAKTINKTIEKIEQYINQLAQCDVVNPKTAKYAGIHLSKDKLDMFVFPQDIEDLCTNPEKIDKNYKNCPVMYTNFIYTNDKQFTNKKDFCDSGVFFLSNNVFYADEVGLTNSCLINDLGRTMENANQLNQLKIVWKMYKLMTDKYEIAKNDEKNTQFDISDYLKNDEEMPDETLTEANKQLYECIMKNVAKEVKKVLRQKL